MITSLKDFLKPTKGKLIIFGFIFLLTIFLRGIVTELKIKTLEVIEKILSPHYLLYTIVENWQIPSPISFGPIFGAIFYYLFIILAFAFGLFFWYLIACLIIFIYERLKEKIKKGKPESSIKPKRHRSYFNWPIN